MFTRRVFTKSFGRVGGLNVTKRCVSDGAGPGAEAAVESNAYRTVAKPPPVQTFTQKRNNTILAACLLTFVGGVYYTAINKMRPETDELERVIAEENLKQ